MEYAIYLGRDAVGKARVEKKGLYYFFECRCDLETDAMCRVMVHWGERQESLGILAPAGKEFVLQKKLPAKLFGEGEPSFRVLPKRQSVAENFYPVYPEEPFSYIARLQNAFLQIKNGQVGVSFRDY